jgi:hypothetical protein
MRRLLRKLTFVPTLLILAGFVAAVILLSKPLEDEESPPTVTGAVRATAELKRDAPLVYYAALNRGRGRPAVEAPEFPLDGAQPDPGETFELAAEQGDGTRFWVLARVETAKIERWCKVVELPPLRRLEDGKWVEAATGKPLRPLEITVDRSTPC